MKFYVFYILDKVKMNLYDRKTVKCIKCDKAFGEIELEVKINSVICKKCKKDTIKKNHHTTFLTRER